MEISSVIDLDLDVKSSDGKSATNSSEGDIQLDESSPDEEGDYENGAGRGSLHAFNLPLPEQPNYTCTCNATS